MDHILPSSAFLPIIYIIPDKSHLSAKLSVYSIFICSCHILFFCSNIPPNRQKSDDFVKKCPS